MQVVLSCKTVVNNTYKKRRLKFSLDCSKILKLCRLVVLLLVYSSPSVGIFLSIF